MGRRLFDGLMLVVLVVAFAVRFPALPQKGIVHWDEAMLLNQARVVASGARLVLARAGLVLPEGQFPRPAEGFETETRWGKLRGFQNNYQKPGQTLLLALGMLVAGEYPWAGQAVSAFFGVLTVALVYAMARPRWGTEAALLAAAALAVSGWHALYSAQALQGINGLFVVALALLWHWRSLRRPAHRLSCLAAGALLGAAFTILDRAVLILPAMAAAEIVLWLSAWRRQRPGSGPGWAGLVQGVGRPMVRLSLVAAGFALVAGVVMGLLALLGVAAARSGVGVPGLQVDYLELTLAQYRYWMSGGGQMAEMPSSLLIYPYLTWQWDGLLLPGLALLGLAAALVRRRPEEISLVVLVLVHYAYFTLSPRGAAQYFLPIGLASAVLAGCWLIRIPRPARPWLAGGLAAVVLALGSARAATLAAVPSGYQQAAEMAIRETGGKHLSNYRAMTMFHAGFDNAVWPEGGLPEVQRAVRDGFWLAIVASAHDDPGQVPAWEREPEMAGARLVAVLPNPAAASLPNIFGRDWRGTFAELLERAQRASDQIKVYDLRPLGIGPTQ